MEYDAAAIGNHEFNYGIEHLAQSTSAARFPFLSANVFRAGTDEHAYRPYTFVERTVSGRTVKIGITSATPAGVMIWDRDNVQGRLDFREIVSSLRPVVQRMRAEGADLVLVAAPAGWRGAATTRWPRACRRRTRRPPWRARSRNRRDLHGAHAPARWRTPPYNGVLVQQAKNWGTSLAVGELDLRWADGRWSVAGRAGRILRPAEGSKSPRLEAALAQAHERTRAYVSQVIGRSTQEWTSAQARVQDTPILDLINDVQMRVTGADISSTAAFSLTSRIPAGPVTVADVAGLYVYDNTLKPCGSAGRSCARTWKRARSITCPAPAAPARRS